MIVISYLKMKKDGDCWIFAVNIDKDGDCWRFVVNKDEDGDVSEMFTVMEI